MHSFVGESLLFVLAFTSGDWLSFSLVLVLVRSFSKLAEIVELR